LGASVLRVVYHTPMRIDIITLFPGMFEGPLTESILQRARERHADGTALLDLYFHDLRSFGAGTYKQIDDRPYGGGAGMVMLAEPIVRAIETVMEMGRRTEDEGEKRQEGKKGQKDPWRIYFSPRGKRLTQSKVERTAKREWLILLCGHYEGIDQRIIDGGWIDEEVSIGEYVLTGGELPAMVLIDAVARQIPGVLGKDESAQEESFSAALGRRKEYPHYTRPEEFRGLKVPDVLLSGNHKEIEKWRRERSG
jgi:tRNA (guanine37-N1)-methyltransferase